MGKKADDHRDPWDMQEGEPKEAFDAFVVYRDMPSRSMRDVAKILGKSRGSISRHMGKWSWTSRCAAWDREQDRVKRDADLKAATEMGQRHATEAATLQDTLLMPAREIARRWKKRMDEDPDGDPFKNLTDLDLIREATKAARVYAQVGIFERLSRGLSTSNVGGHEGGPIEFQHRERVERMARPEIETYLRGVGPSAEAIAKEYDLPAPPVMGSPN